MLSRGLDILAGNFYFKAGPCDFKFVSRNSRKVVDVVHGEDLPRAVAGRDICLQAAGEGGGAGV